MTVFEFLGKSEKLLLLTLDLTLQRHQGVQHRFGSRRASGHIDVDRNYVIDSREGCIVVIEPAGRGAGAKRHHPLRLGHLFVDPAQNRSLPYRYGSDYHQKVGLPWRKPRQQGAEAVQVIGRRRQRHVLHCATCGRERIRKNRKLPGPCHCLVQSHESAVSPRIAESPLFRAATSSLRCIIASIGRHVIHFLLVIQR